MDNSRSLVSTLVAAFYIFFLFWGQVHALYLSHYYVALANLVYPPIFTSTSSSIWTSMKTKLATGLLALMYPFISFTLTLWTRLSAWKMEENIYNYDTKHRIQLKKEDDIDQRWSGEEDGRFVDRRSVRVLIGAQVYLSIPNEANRNIIDNKYSGIMQRYVGEDEKIPDDPPLEINPTMLLNDTEETKKSILHVLLLRRQSRANATRLMEQSRKECIQLNILGKEALLKLGFVPPYAYLRQLKYQNGWEITLFATSSAGYFLEMIVRWVAHKPISPIEGLAAFISILMVLQTFSQIFLGGCTPLFKESILIKLTDKQLIELLKRVPKLDQIDSPRIPFYKYLFLAILQLIVVAGPMILAFFYTLRHFNHNNSALYECKMCTLSPILFVGNYVVFIVVIVLTWAFSNKNICRTGFLLVVFNSIALTIIATLSTVQNWERLQFNETTTPWYKFLIPHMS